MKKTVITLSMATALLFGGALFTDTAKANTEDQLKEKQSELKDERAEVKKDLSKAEAEIADLLFDLEDLNEEINQLDEALDHNKKAIKETEDNISQLEEEVAELEENIAELQERIDTRTEILKDRISSYQKTGGNVNVLDVILGSKSFGDLISRVSAVTKITNADQDLIDQQEADQEKVIEQQNLVEQKLDEEVALKTELEEIKAITEEQQKESKEKKKEIQKEEKELKKLVSKLEDEDRSLAQLEASVKQELDDIRSAATLTTLASNSGNSGSSSKSSNSGGSQTSNVPSGGAVNAALSRVGKNNVYVWAGKSPSTGFDCSGFVSWAHGGSIPSSTAGLASVGHKISLSEARAGDLIFFDTYKTNGHVGIYLGNGQWVGSQSSTGVAVTNLSNSYWKSKFNGHVRRIN